MNARWGRVCRVAVVEDDPLQLSRLVEDLKGAEERYRLPASLEIFPFDSAEVVADRIRGAPDGAPPWDVILADVMIPDPEGARSEVDNGAFLIADAILARYDRPVPVRMAAISVALMLPAVRRRLVRFEGAAGAGWFWAFGKPHRLPDPDREADGEFESWRRALSHIVSMWSSDHWGTWAFANRATDRDWLDFARGTFKSFASAALLAQITRISQEEETRNVLILGETGAGKEIAGRMLHALRNPQNAPFRPINCSEFRGEMLASELWGHTRGGFTGAVTDRPGIFESAAGGTAFLDEIGGMEESEQRVLLRFLTDYVIPKVGANPAAYRRFEGNLLLFATSAEMSTRPLIEDLHYRLLDGVQITVPPLRERREDIVATTQYFLSKAGTDGPTLTADALQWLERDTWIWPGNLRTLKALVGMASENLEVRTITALDLEKAAARLAKEHGVRLDGPPGRPPETPVAFLAPKSPETYEDFARIIEANPGMRNFRDLAEKIGWSRDEKSGGRLSKMWERKKWPKPAFTGGRQSRPRPRS